MCVDVVEQLFTEMTATRGINTIIVVRWVVRVGVEIGQCSKILLTHHEHANLLPLPPEGSPAPEQLLLRVPQEQPSAVLP